MPLRLASTYKRMEREGIFTPDENLIYESTHDLEKIKHVVRVGNDVRGLSIGRIEVGDEVVAENLKASRYEEDGVILSLCNRKSSLIAVQMKKAACVKIFDVEFLKSVIDKQLGIEGDAKPCEYTAGYERNHFLKSDKDKWQDEFRIFWRHQCDVEVQLPPGIARRIKI